MSLFALSNEYQRSSYRSWEDFSDHPQVQAESDPEAVENRSHRSVLRLDNQREGAALSRTQKSMAFRAAGESEFLQHDAKAWGRFLDSKRRE